MQSVLNQRGPLSSRAAPPTLGSPRCSLDEVTPPTPTPRLPPESLAGGMRFARQRLAVGEREAKLP